MKVLRISAKQADGRIHVEVADRGIGIPADEIEHVFEKFFRGRSSVAQGSGLGLAIAQRIVLENGGNIRLRSEPETGTTVEIELPIEGNVCINAY